MKKTIEIIYEDKWLVAIDKPSGLMSVAGNGKDVETAYMLVNDYLMHKYNGRVKAHVLHRLDRDTSGVLLFAKDFGVKRAMTDNWNERVVERKYVAVVDGVPEATKSAVPEGDANQGAAGESLGTKENRENDNTEDNTELPCGRIVSWLTENDRNFMVQSSLKDNGGEVAVTNWRVLKTDGKRSLVEFLLETGRKNQIRVQAAAHLHCPVLGDPKYGDGKSARRLCLHAKGLSIVHPVTRKVLKITANTPRYFGGLVGNEPAKTMTQIGNEPAKTGANAGEGASGQSRRREQESGHVASKKVQGGKEPAVRHPKPSDKRRR